MTHLNRTARTVARVVAAVAMFACADAAHAQLGPMFGPSGPFLNRADFAQADQAVKKLLEPKPAAIGTSETWANATSGDSGTLTMERAYEKGGNDCRSVRWHDVYKDGTDRAVLLDTCHIAGEWKLM